MKTEHQILCLLAQSAYDCSRNPFCITEGKLQAELAAIEAEAMGWLPLEAGAYLRVGEPEALVITVTGLPDAGMAGMNVLLVG